MHRVGWRAGQTTYRQPLLEALSASGLVGRHGDQKNCGRRERLLLSWLQWSWSSRYRLPGHESLGLTTLLIARSTDGASRPRATGCPRPNARAKSRQLSRLPWTAYLLRAASTSSAIFDCQRYGLERRSSSLGRNRWDHAPSSSSWSDEQLHGQACLQLARGIPAIAGSLRPPHSLSLGSSTNAENYWAVNCSVVPGPSFR